jgi:ATP-dependent DNA ligase
LPRTAQRPPNGAGWIHEIKHDGFRIIARRDAKGVRLFTRNGYDFTARFPKIVDVFYFLIEGPLVGAQGLHRSIERLQSRLVEAGDFLA